MDQTDTTGLDAPLPPGDAKGQLSASRGDALGQLSASLGAVGRTRGLPPVEKWNPPFCGDIDMRIDREGVWFYGGTPIGRPALVRLFASVLRRDPERYVLVTPVERVGIEVADVPFMAVEMAVDGDGPSRGLAFRTNVDDLIQVDSEHSLRFDTDSDGGVKPYVRVRGGLWARLTRALTYDLVELGESRIVAGETTFGVAVGGAFYPIASGAAAAILFGDAPAKPDPDETPA